MNLAPRIIIIIALQTAALATMIGMKQWTLNNGTPIVLKTQPIDPRSLFSGDYVRLNYTISRLKLDELGGEKDFEHRDRVYVLLQPGDDGYWQAVSAHHAPPVAGSGQVVIKGEVEYVGNEPWRAAPGEPTTTVKTMQVHYGIENYYVPEGEGRALERPKADEVVSIRVAVDRYGNTGIKAVLVNGAERYTEKLF